MAITGLEWMQWNFHALKKSWQNRRLFLQKSADSNRAREI